MSSQIQKFDTSDLLFRESAKFISNLICEKIQTGGNCSFVLSGGSTPKGLYQILGSNEYRNIIKWRKVLFFWGDERCVPPDSNESNYKTAFDSLISKIDTPEQNIFRVYGEIPHFHAALDYEKRLKTIYDDFEFPVFDIILLGLGEDGHTASLFPGSKALNEKQKWITDNYDEKLKNWRITMTLPVISSAKLIIFLVSGKSKSIILKKVLNGKNPDLPASLIDSERGNVFWFMDKEAGGYI